MTERYDGLPFLKLLESYVLRAIGHLDRDAEAALQRLEPLLEGTFGQPGAWHEIVASQMDFPEGLPDEIRRIWVDGEAKAHGLGLTVDPNEFTRQFVDTNFRP